VYGAPFLISQRARARWPSPRRLSPPAPAPRPLAEIQSFYERGWKDMSKRFFGASAWPTAREVRGSARRWCRPPLARAPRRRRPRLAAPRPPAFRSAHSQVAPLVRDDRAFLALYRLLFYRHILANLNSAEAPVTFAQFAEVRTNAQRQQQQQQRQQ